MFLGDRVRGVEAGIRGTTAVMLLFARGGPDAILGLGVRTGSLGRESQRTLDLQERITRLYEEFREPLFRYLLWIGLAPEECEETIQETFLRLFKHLHGGGREDNLKSWLYKVSHNLTLNRLRSRRHFEEATPEQWQSLREAAFDPAPSPEDLLLHKERLLGLRHTIASLSPLQRSCVHLRIAGFRYREIAEILGVTIQTVSESLRRAMEKLTRSQQ